MAKATKTPVTLVQNTAGQVTAVRIGDSGPIAVAHAGPAVGIGQMNLVVQIADVEISYEPVPIDAPQA